MKIKNKLFISLFISFFLSSFVPFEFSLNFSEIKFKKAEASGESWETGYDYRRKITIDHTKVSGTANLSNFPVLISITNADLKNTDNGGKVENDNGYDIVFTDSDGATQLDYEMENYDPVAGTVIAWVNFPILHYDTDQDIYIYYGNSSINSSQENKSGLWSNYGGVWHMNDLSSSTVADSTDNGNTGNKTLADNPFQDDGKIHKSQNFNGSDSITYNTDTSALNWGNDWTLSFWVNLNAGSQNTHALFHRDTGGSIRIVLRPTNYFTIYEGYGDEGSSGSINPGDWTFITITSANNVLTWYNNGTPQDSTGQLYNSHTNTQDFYAGGGNEGYFVNAKEDEIRMIGNVALSADWIKTEYNNQNIPDTFSSLGTEEAGNSAPASPTSPLQYKSDGTTLIANQGYTTETSVKLKASATDANNPDIITLFFETALHDGAFASPAVPTTGTSCVSGTEWDSCASKIWYVTSGSDDYSSTPYTGTTSVAGLGNDGYKWQVKACDDDGACSAWVEYNATVPNFTVDGSTPDIVAVDAGASNVDRISLASATWFKYSDTGSDDQISFSWTDPASVSDDNFYYELNSDSLNTITGDESTTADPYVDDVAISEGISYFHVRPKNGAGTWGTERKFTIKYDKSAPINVSVDLIVADSSSQLTVVADVATDAYSAINASPYWFNETTGGAGGSSSVVWQAGTTFVDDGLSPNVQYSYQVKARDTLENESAYSAISSKYTLANAPNNLTGLADSQTQITINWEANSNSAGTEYYAENTTAGTNSGWATTLTWASSGLTCGTSYSFQVKARNGDSVDTASTAPILITTSACAVPIAEEEDDDDDNDNNNHHKKKTVVSTVVQTVKKYLGLGEEEPETITEEVAVPEAAPPVFQGNWSLLPTEDINQFALQNLPSNIQLAAGKFPELQNTFSSLGVEKASDMTRLVSANLALSGLSKIAEIPQGDYIALAQLSPEEKEKIPSEIVFARMAGGLVDLNSYLKMDAKGNLNQEINAIAGKSLQLLVKMEKPASGVSGYVVFNSAGTEETPNFSSASQNKLLSFFGNTAFAQNNNFSEKEKMLVLEKFQYADPDGDGIYEADINVPLVGGKYKIVTKIEYADVKLASKDIEVITVVDPEGYIYEKIGEGEMRIPNAAASLFWLDPADGQYKLWPAEKFMQKNPQITDKKGTYSFLVPEGTYFLKAEAPGYTAYESEKFEVREGNGVHQNIELKKKYGWFSFENWEHIVLIIVTSALIVVTILLIYNFYQDRLRARIIKRR